MSAAKFFLLGIIVFAAILTVWWFMPPAVQADLTKKFQPQSEQSAKTQAASTGNAPVQTTVYKWKDANGQQHFSNTPPKDQKYQEIQYRNDANVVGPN